MSLEGAVKITTPVQNTELFNFVDVRSLSAVLTWHTHIAIFLLHEDMIRSHEYCTYTTSYQVALIAHLFLTSVLHLCHIKKESNKNMFSFPLPGMSFKTTSSSQMSNIKVSKTRSELLGIVFCLHRQDWVAWFGPFSCCYGDESMQPAVC